MKYRKRALVIAGVVSALAVPTTWAALSASAGTMQIGTPGCYVEVDYLEPNIVIGGTKPPFVTADPSGSAGAGVHCPI